VASATTADAAILSSGILNLSVASLGSPVANGVGSPTPVNFALGGNGGNGGAGGLLGWNHDSANNHSVVTLAPSAGSTLEFAQTPTFGARHFAAGTFLGSAGGNGGAGGAGWSFAPVLCSLARYDGSNDLVHRLSGSIGPPYLNPDYLAFRFQDGSGNYLYGWAELAPPATAALGEQFTLVQWAYNDDPNAGILVGMHAVPLPGAAALAAGLLGSIGRGGGRRRRPRGD